MVSTIGTRCTPECKKPTPFQAHCSVCHRTFGGISGFDRHRKSKNQADPDSDRYCLDPTTFGYVEREQVWREPMDQDKIAKFVARVHGDRKNT